MLTKQPHLMNATTLCLGLFIGISTTVVAQDVPRLIGYLPDYRAATFDSAAAQPLTDLIIFSAEPTATGGLDMARLKDMPWAKLREHRKQHQTRLLLCVGGWERSQHFATIVADKDKRAAFVQAVSTTLTNEQLDGLDLDWEHPKNAAEQQGYASLLGDLQTAFTPKKWHLSVTMAAWQQLPKAAYTAVQTVNLMAYDHDDQHATYANAVRDVKTMLAAGVPANKLVLGVPFYGRHRTKRALTLTYREIVAKHKPTADVDEIDGIYFNGPTTLRKKVALVHEQKLAGLMVWEIGQDAEGEQALLPMLHQASRKK